MAPATALQDELAEEILRRLPPDDPALLVRAALVCKHSCRLIADPGFHRRFREFHAAPPMLGFFRNTTSLRATGREIVRFVLGEAVAGLAVPDEPPTFARFVSTSSLRPPRASWDRNWRVVDARHGRVLLLRKTPWGNNHFLVWDPSRMRSMTWGFCLGRCTSTISTPRCSVLMPAAATLTATTTLSPWSI
jgi:hypothetical protein